MSQFVFTEWDLRDVNEATESLAGGQSNIQMFASIKLSCLDVIKKNGASFDT